MTDAALQAAVLQRLDAQSGTDAGINDRAGLLVLAALDDRLDEALEQSVDVVPAVAAVAFATPPAFYLGAISAAGFRGVGPKATLRLHAGPGLTVITGRNGSGKSSFAEAAEVALTRTSARWAHRSAVWQQGFRNLHVGDPCTVEVTLAVDGVAGTTGASCTWTPGAPVGDLTSTGVPERWESALRTYRPFLSYAELGALVDGKPTEMYDALQALLGLEDITAAEKRLKTERSSLETRAKEVRGALAPLLVALRSCPDERAAEALRALEGRTRDLDAAERLATGAGAPRDDEEGLLQRVRMLELPAPFEVASAVEEARDAAAAVVVGAASEAALAADMVHLLGLALRAHERRGDGRCEVCGAGRWDAEWAERTSAQLHRHEEFAAASTGAGRRLEQALRALAELRPASPTWLASLTAIDTSYLDSAWKRWTGVDPREGGAFAASHASVVTALSATQADAEREAARRQDLWQPVAVQLGAWVARAREGQERAETLLDLKAAETWVKTALQELRDERLDPLATESQRVWEMLRQESSVTLGPVTLASSGPRRHVSLDVTVDGQGSEALSVMSQGELHALGLALFLPRATATASPFRFIVIDDPVQAMDPSKVDGLARLLSETAQTRQVLVFTHDDRLPESLRALGLPATVWEVVRREGSQVELRKAEDPVGRYLDDARALARTEELSEEVRSLAAAGFCRSAIEAACAQRFRRERFEAGVRHVEVEDELSTCTTVTTYVALALFGDRSRGREVLPRLDRRDRKYADAFRWCKESVHPGATGDVPARVADVQRLCAWIQT